MTEVVIQQILKVRDSGETNMFDMNKVFQIAMQQEFYELADYLLEHKASYTQFILTGKIPDNENE